MTDQRQNRVRVTFLFLMIALVAVVIWKILFSNHETTVVIQGGTSEDSISAAQAIAYADRMSSTAEWTIASILTLGTALIGLNWYIASKNYDADRDRLTNLEKSVGERFEERISQSEASITQTFERVNSLEARESKAAASFASIASFTFLRSNGQETGVGPNWGTMMSDLRAIIMAMGLIEGLGLKEIPQPNIEEMCRLFLSLYSGYDDHGFPDYQKPEFHRLVSMSVAIVSRLATSEIQTEWMNWATRTRVP